MSEVSSAYNWYDKGQLLARFPKPPLIMLQSVEMMSAGISRAQSERIEKQKAKNK